MKSGPYGLVTVEPQDALTWLKTYNLNSKLKALLPKRVLSGFLSISGDTFLTQVVSKARAFKSVEGKQKCTTARFSEALDALSKMETPRFRRPNSNNRYGIVKGIRWVYKTKEELGLL